MSIQITKSRKLINRILYKLRLMEVIDNLSFQKQKRLRSKIDSHLKIFFPYFNHYTHPYIRDRWYDFNAPVQWVNDENADLIHVISFPPLLKDNRPVIIEPNDQILTLCAYFGAKTPSECLSKIPETKLLIADDRLKAILVGKDGLKDQFIYYFGEEYLYKVIEFPQMRVLPKYTAESLSKKITTEGEEIIFLFLASSYTIKAVEIVIEAWIRKVPLNSKLIIACSDIPGLMMKKISNENSITIINQAPLNLDLKNKLLKSSAVTISVSHIDGGANAWEGMEYGHAIITNDNHRKDCLVGNNNGVVIPFKNNFYEMGRYGIEWNSFEEYLNIVQTDFENGFYDVSISKLSEAIILLSERRDILTEMRLRSIELAWSQSVQNSNQKLLEVYTNALASV